MIVRLILAALAAGLIAGLAMTPAQYVKVVPLILQAESYETADSGGHHHGPADTAALSRAEGTGAHAHAHDDEGAAPGLGRFGNTVLANLVAGGGFALMLAAAALLAGIEFPKGREALGRGLALGAAGWFAVQLAPGWGLPPELPGFPHIDLQARQLWWVATATLSAGGLYLVALRHEIALKIAGLALIVAPHLYGAPRPTDIASNVPAFLASEYAAAALATTLFFWLVLGAALGYFLSRAAPAEPI